MKQCHMANGHPRRKIPKFPDGGGQAFPDGGGRVRPRAPPVAPRLRYIVFKTSGSIKERTQTSTEMVISCQRNGHWAATNHLSGGGLVQPIEELSSAGQGGVPEGAAH